MKRTYLNLFIYISLIFLLITLIRNDYLNIPNVENWLYLIFSFVFLFFYHLACALNWQVILSKHKIITDYATSFASIGLMTFGKYIPGKIWTVLGQAGYIANSSNIPVNEVSVISLEYLIINLWVGLIMGAIGLLLAGGLNLWGWLILSFWILLTILLFVKTIHKIAQKILSFILKKDIVIPWLNTKSKLSLFPYAVLNWGLLSIGFYFLIVAFISDRIPLYIGLGFPLAGILGIAAFFSPGGLGIREGVLVGFLKMVGMTTVVAITISVVSRLWFVIGEATIFFISLLLDKRKGV